MKSLARMSYLVISFALVILAACGKGPASSPTSNPNRVYTQIWETVAVGQTQTAAAMPPTQEATNTPEATVTPKMTNTPLVSSTPAAGETAVAPTGQATTANTPRPTSQDLCDNAEFVTDVTYPDNTVVTAGLAIIKTWRIKNLGPCKWNQDYKLVFGWGGDGTEWSTTPGSYFNKLVEVGDTIDLSIELLVPTKAGTYSATYRTQNDNDFNFGPTLTIVIVVK